MCVGWGEIKQKSVSEAAAELVRASQLCPEMRHLQVSFYKTFLGIPVEPKTGRVDGGRGW